MSFSGEEEDEEEGGGGEDGRMEREGREEEEGRVGEARCRRDRYKRQTSLQVPFCNIYYVLLSTQRKIILHHFN